VAMDRAYNDYVWLMQLTDKGVLCNALDARYQVPSRCTPVGAGMKVKGQQ